MTGTEPGHSALLDAANERARELWGEDWRPTTSTPDVDGLPPMDLVEEKTSRMRELADDYLDGAISQRIRSWENGAFEIRIHHGYGPHGDSQSQLRTVLRYHSQSGDVTGAVVELEGSAERVYYVETITNIGPAETN